MDRPCTASRTSTCGATSSPASASSPRDALVGRERPGLQRQRLRRRRFAQTLVLAGQTLIIRVGSPTEGSEGEGVLEIVCTPIGGDPCPEDINGDDVVDAADLGLLVGAWATSDAAADVNDDGIVDAADLGLVIGRWGPC